MLDKIKHKYTYLGKGTYEVSSTLQITSSIKAYQGYNGYVDNDLLDHCTLRNCSEIAHLLYGEIDNSVANLHGEIMEIIMKSITDYGAYEKINNAFREFHKDFNKLRGPKAIRESIADGGR